MPYKPHIRVTALGRLSESGERFSYGINMERADAPDILPDWSVADQREIGQDLASDFAAFHADPRMRLSNLAVLEVVKVVNIGADGKYQADPITFDVGNIRGGEPQSVVSQAVLPQSALAVSLVTARRGPSGKGRFYLPMPVVQLDAPTLMVGDSIRDTMEQACGEFLSNLQNAPGIDVTNLRVVVASTKGFNTPITGVRLGRVVDTIRSRRRSIPEDYDIPTPVS